MVKEGGREGIIIGDVIVVVVVVLTGCCGGT